MNFSHSQADHPKHCGRVSMSYLRKPAYLKDKTSKIWKKTQTCLPMGVKGQKVLVCFSFQLALWDLAFHQQCGLIHHRFGVFHQGFGAIHHGFEFQMQGFCFLKANFVFSKPIVEMDLLFVLSRFTKNFRGRVFAFFKWTHKTNVFCLCVDDFCKWGAFKYISRERSYLEAWEEGSSFQPSNLQL